MYGGCAWLCSSTLAPRRRAAAAMPTCRQPVSHGYCTECECTTAPRRARRNVVHESTSARRMFSTASLPRASSFCAVFWNTMSNSALSSGSSTRSSATVAMPPRIGGPCATTTTRMPV